VLMARPLGPRAGRWRAAERSTCRSRGRAGWPSLRARQAAGRPGVARYGIACAAQGPRLRLPRGRPAMPRRTPASPAESEQPPRTHLSREPSTAR